MLAHCPHSIGEGADTLWEAGTLEVLHHLVPVFDGIDPRQAGIKEGLQIILVALRRDGSDDLVAIEVIEEMRGLLRIIGETIVGARKQDAGEPRSAASRI
ncbi:MAG TPA: hypothetical protein VIJ04_18955 [Xanthobacteraceae bacterium]